MGGEGRLFVFGMLSMSADLAHYPKASCHLDRFLVLFREVKSVGVVFRASGQFRAVQGFCAWRLASFMLGGCDLHVVI